MKAAVWHGRRGVGVGEVPDPAVTEPTDAVFRLTLFDKQIRLRMGRAGGERRLPEILPLLSGEDVLGVDEFASRPIPPAQTAEATDKVRRKADRVVEVVPGP